ncbi:acyl-CoA carboxylase subunit beta [Anaeromicropila populeti]|uniref:Acetyl-CoA carboxylase, carboxyltransferase component n=1 Tax=Anaeromicropila populeti TaxID=37658 RepID=A0A1I6L7B9_9FIRM|nr:carboxyl transferase domain-containing protein [Anaeromicropila populeti]SFR99118.1 Acetyl-CoA carboxylase, carboxyltransferase component [Anaeromicropila populeti]
MSNTAQTSAMERIHALLDDNSFVEIGAKVTKRSTDFNLQEKSVPGDGVITGYGVIEGNLVYVYSQDSSVLGGSIGEMHAKKIAHIYDMALKVGAPVIGLIDCAGLRLQEAVDALAGFGDLYLKQTLASGVIPQLTAVFGTCGGGSAISSALSDFTFMEEKKSKLFVNSPNTLDGNYTEKCDTSAAKFQAGIGMADFVEADEAAVLNQIRTLVQMIPSNNEDDASYEECTDDLNRLSGNASAKDSSVALADIADDNFFMEVKASYAKDMVTGFLRLNGMTVGAVANRSEILDANGKVSEKFDGTLTTDGCKKAVEFIAFCNAFQIPLLSLTNVTGFKATMEEEKTIAKAVAKLTYAFANATVPKINVVTGKAYGSAYVAMNSKHIGADMVFGFTGAEIGMMDAKQAVKIMYADEIQKEKGSSALVDEKASEYSQLQSSVDAAAGRGYVDAVIEPENARKNLIYAYEMLFTKRESRPSKKHGTV